MPAHFGEHQTYLSAVDSNFLVYGTTSLGPVALREGYIPPWNPLENISGEGT